MQGREHSPTVGARTEVTSSFHGDFDAKNTRLEVEKERNQAQILSILSGWVYDMRKMKRLLVTEPPLEIEQASEVVQQLIMKRLPVESLVRFRTVSRLWKYWIDSPEFIDEHENQPQHLLVNYKEREGGDAKFVSFVDDSSFPRLRAFPALPPHIRRPMIVGSSSGLLCLYCYDSEMAFIWNPCIRKAKPINVRADFENENVFAFGVCPLTIDPKFLHITYLCAPDARSESESASKHQFGQFWKVELYTLSSGLSKNLSSSSSNLPGVSLRINERSGQVVIGSHIYWCAQEDGKTATRNLLMSFDITFEKFRSPVDLPGTLASRNPFYLSLSMLRNSLVMLEYNQKHSFCHVWKMGNGTFTHLFTIRPPCNLKMLRPVGFTNMGAPIMSVQGPTFCYSTQLVYDPDSNKHSNLLLSSYADTYFVASYMETLLLIGRPDCISTSF